jgi:calcineurin-like phosphoesterase family protein
MVGPLFTVVVLMRKNTFLISDTWFNRLVNAKDGETIDACNDRMIENWNNAVKPTDEVFVLGGFGIGDLYNIVKRLNGHIIFLNNCFSNDEFTSMQNFVEAVDDSIDDKNFAERISFNKNQVAILGNYDVVLSYLPLKRWVGDTTGVICCYGYEKCIEPVFEEGGIKRYAICCSAKEWDASPVSISNIKSSIKKYEELYNIKC